MGCGSSAGHNRDLTGMKAAYRSAEGAAEIKVVSQFEFRRPTYRTFGGRSPQ